MSNEDEQMENEVIIKELILQLQAFSKMISDIIDLIYNYKIERAFEKLIDLTENYVKIEAVLGVDTATNEVFNLIMTAMNDSDYILIADMLQFELLDGTERLVANLEESIRV